MAVTEIPNDFFLDKRNYTDNEVEIRFSAVGWKIFVKKHEGDEDPKPDENLLAAFKERLSNLRSMIIGFAAPRIESIFVKRFEMMYPDFTFGGGRKVTSIAAFIDAVINEPYDKRMRGIIHTTQNTLWGNNTWAVKLEGKTMQMTGLAYTGEYMTTKPKKNHDGNSIKDAVIKSKNVQIVQRIKRTVHKFYMEVLYKRNVGISALVIELVPATIETWGFIGYVGLCAGHPILKQRIESEPPRKNPGNKVDMYAWFQQMLAKGVTSREKLLEEAAKQGDAPGPVPAAKTENCVSPPVSDVSNVPDGIMVSVLYVFW